MPIEAIVCITLAGMLGTWILVGIACELQVAKQRGRRPRVIDAVMPWPWESPKPVESAKPEIWPEFKRLADEFVELGDVDLAKDLRMHAVLAGEPLEGLEAPEPPEPTVEERLEELEAEHQALQARAKGLEKGLADQAALIRAKEEQVALLQGELARTGRIITPYSIPPVPDSKDAPCKIRLTPPGEPIGEARFIPTHDYDDGVCRLCGEHEPWVDLEAY